MNPTEIYKQAIEGSDGSGKTSGELLLEEEESKRRHMARFELWSTDEVGQEVVTELKRRYLGEADVVCALAINGDEHQLRAAAVSMLVHKKTLNLITKGEFQV